MAFIQPCFIRKKTTELIEKLVAMGYNYPKKYHEIFPNLLTIPYKGHGWGTLIGVSDKEIDLALKLRINQYPTIDCGTNEDLFLALVALRDDTDVNQWFVMDVEEYMDINQGDWLIATDRNKGKHIGTQIDPMYCHKATVEEIIEHFSDCLLYKEE